MGRRSRTSFAKTYVTFSRHKFPPLLVVLQCSIPNPLFNTDAGLESESRTLAKRISAISLGSSSDAPTTGFDSNPGSPTYPSFKASTLNAPYVNGKTPTANRTRTVSNPRQGKVQPQSQTQTQTQMHAPASPQKHPQTPSKSPMTQRARTYSSPHRSDLPSSSGLSARPPMPMLPKPTRIPKRSPVLGVGAGGGPTLNGSGTGAGYGPTPSHGGVTVFGSTQTTTTNGFSGPNANGYTFVNGYTYASGPLATTATTASSSHSTLDLTAVQPSGRTQGYSQAHRLLHEAPPFSSSSASDLEADVSMTSTVSFGSGFGQPSSSSGVRRAEMDMDMASAPRSSMDSEELPYEHWYRGEVSRNGGVGELRVGRRQEMLDIANYGHLVEQRRRGVDGYNTHHSLATRRRRRAGSIGGVTEAIRERGSIYIDDDDFDHRANEVSNVMDEHPLTDLEGETSLSDVDGSLHGHQRQTTIRLGTRGASTDTQRPVDTTPGYAYTPEEEGEGWSSIAGAHEIRSVTPTASNPLGRSLNGQAPPPTRIPGPSSRHSSESRSTVNATSPIRGAASEQGSTKTTFGSTSPTPMASAKSAPMSSGSTSPTPAATGTAKKPVMKKNAGKPPPVTKAKKTPSKAADKGKKGKEDDRRSVAHYPTPDGDEDMADAIPSWTQPVQKQGGWDEVCGWKCLFFYLSNPQ